MSDKKKVKKRKEEEGGAGGEGAGAGAGSALERAVARYLRRALPAKRTKLHAHPVVYFTGRRAVDALMSSEWATSATSAPSTSTASTGSTGSAKHKALFHTRHDAVVFLNTMLMHKFFHRAKKVAVSEAELKSRRGAGGAGGAGGGEGAGAAAGPGAGPGAGAGAVRRRKVRLEMTGVQVFEDGGDAYVWVWEEVPAVYWALGLGVVAAAIALCLFPLWPAGARRAVYWASVGAALLLAAVLLLAVLRALLFVLVWALSAGRHHLWLLPNLTEDCGFLASFTPLYTHTYCGPAPASASISASTATAAPGEAEGKGEGRPPDEEGLRGGGGGGEARSSSSERDYEMVEHPDSAPDSTGPDPAPTPTPTPSS